MSETEIITAPEIIPQIKRGIAKALHEVGEKDQPYDPNAFAFTKNKDILATIIWDIVTTGEGALANGKIMKPESYTDWLATVKYLITHLDGPVAGDEGIGTNVYKVYVGINIDKV